MQHSELLLAVHRLLRTPEVVLNHLNVVASRLWLWFVCRPCVRMFGDSGPFQHWFSDDVLVSYLM